MNQSLEDRNAKFPIFSVFQKLFPLLGWLLLPPSVYGLEGCPRINSLVNIHLRFDYQGKPTSTTIATRVSIARLE